jgi:hypothetical protein
MFTMERSAVKVISCLFHALVLGVALVLLSPVHEPEETNVQTVRGIATTA